MVLVMYNNKTDEVAVSFLLSSSSAYVSSNDENGERMLHTAPSSPLPRAPALPPKQGIP